MVLITPAPLTPLAKITPTFRTGVIWADQVLGSEISLTLSPNHHDVSTGTGPVQQARCGHCEEVDQPEKRYNRSDVYEQCSRNRGFSNGLSVFFSHLQLYGVPSSWLRKQAPFCFVLLFLFVVLLFLFVVLLLLAVFVVVAVFIIFLLFCPQFLLIYVSILLIFYSFFSDTP